MAKYCLIGEKAEEFKRRLKNKEIDPKKLALMKSSERREFFKTFLDEENAKNVNILFERKLLAKRRWDAMIKWASETTGIKPAARRDLIAKIEKMRKTKDGNLLSPQEESAFLEDLASNKIGVEVTFEEASKINELAQEIEKSKSKDMAVHDNRIEYGNNILDMYDYVNSLKPGMTKWEQVANIANVPRTLMATLDFSAPFRQGFGLVGRKEFWKNLKPMFQAAFSEQAYRNFQADIVTRGTYDNMKKSGLRLTGLGDKLTQKEEAYMTTLLEKFPGIRGSERGYTMFLTKLRADTFDTMIKQADLAGEDIRPGSKTSKDIANFINNFTGAGTLINRGVDQSTGPIANAAFFSPRLIASRIQMLNPVNYLNPSISATARKEALKSIIAAAGLSGTALYLASLAGADVETDPRSSDFGKFKIGDTRFDTTAGVGAYVTLLARLATNQTKSTTSDIVREMGESIVAPSRGDTFIKFFRNKLSPTASFVADWMYGENAVGEPFKFDKALIDRVYPLLIQEVIDVAEDNPSLAVPVFLGSLFGISSQTFNGDANWNNSTGKELGKFRDKVGQQKFDEANEKYNRSVSEKTEKVLKDARYKALDSDGKQKVITKIKNQEKEKIFKEYGFKYKQEKEKKDENVLRELTR